MHQTRAYWGKTMTELAYMGVPVNPERALFIQMMHAIAHKAEQETDEFWGNVYDQLQDPRKAKMMGDKWRLALEAMRFGQRLPALTSNQAVDLKQPEFIQFAANQRITAYFENGQLVIPSGQGRSVPLALGISWQAWQTAIYLAMGILPNLQDQHAIQQVGLEENATDYYDGRTGHHVDWANAPADASHFRLKDGAFYKKTPQGIVCYNSTLCQWDTRICNVNFDTGRWITRPNYVLFSNTKLHIEGFALPVEKQLIINVLARFFKGLSNDEIRKELNIALAKSRNIVIAFKAEKIPASWVEEARATELSDAD